MKLLGQQLSESRNMKRTFASTNIHEATSPVYLDCNATAPIEPSVHKAVSHWFGEEIGNAGSRTHEYGLRAKRAVNGAREEIAAVVRTSSDEVVFTSGATESNNIAILGLAYHGEKSGRQHIVSTAMEHKAVLEPLDVLRQRGFDITLLKPDRSGAVRADDIRRAMRDDTLLVSVMHANNETGVKQPLAEIADVLKGHEAFFHVDAAQGFGKDIDPLRSPRIDLVSISSHKIYGPVGVGALVTRKRGFARPPLQPLVFGGGQERGLRAGTLPVPLIVGLGMAAKLALRDGDSRRRKCEEIRREALAALEPVGARLHGDPAITLPHVLNFSVGGVDSEALMVALKDIVSVSNGSACTSQNYEPSHVLEAMDLPADVIAGAVRLSWSHLTEPVNWTAIAERIASFN